MDFNTPTRTTATETTNYEGGAAWVPDDPRFELYLLVSNQLLENTYYRSDDQALAEVRDAFARTVDAGHTGFPVQLAAYARQELNLRQIPQVLLVLAADDDRTKGVVREWAPQIIQRADEPCTVVAIHDTLVGGTLPKPLKKGINDALHQFDAYQFSKYTNDQREVSLRDVINRTHPRPQDDERAAIFESLIRGPLDDHPDVDPLEPPRTWETVISERGNTAAAWVDVLPDMGLFATIRNLRNMLEAGVPVNAILDAHGDAPSWVGQTRILPFRFYQAYQAITDAGVSEPAIEDWLSQLIDAATANIPDQMGNSLVAVDLSGSMDSPLSDGSQLTYKELAAFFGAATLTRGADVMAFGSEVVPVQVHHQTPTLQATETILSRDQAVGGSTNGWKAIDALHKTGGDPTTVDRIIILTDMQIWDSTGGLLRSADRTVREAFSEYREAVNADARLYTVDLSSYGTLVTPETSHSMTISGWDDGIFDYIEHAEHPQQIVDEIATYTPDT